jgi:hypothetical protein
MWLSVFFYASRAAAKPATHPASLRTSFVLSIEWLSFYADCSM